MIIIARGTGLPHGMGACDQDPLDEVAAELTVAGGGPHPAFRVGLIVGNVLSAGVIGEDVGQLVLSRGGGAFLAHVHVQGRALAQRAPVNLADAVAVQRVEEAQRGGDWCGPARLQGFCGGGRAA